MGRNMEARRGCDDWFVDHDRKVAKLGEALGAVIRYAAKDKSITQLAKEIHYTRTTLTTLLNQKAEDEKQRGWTFSTLIAIADALGLRLSQLIAEAEDVAKCENYFSKLGLTLQDNNTISGAVTRKST